MNRLLLLEAGGSALIIAFLIMYTRMVKRKLRRHVLRNKEVERFIAER